MKKTIIPTLLFLLLSCLACAAVDLRPPINITFQEIVKESTLTISLTNQSDDQFALENVISDNPTFIYRPAADLPEGFYTIRVQAEDLNGILGPVLEFVFLIAIPPLRITLENPPLGVSPVTPFDFKISTDRVALCKYSFLEQSYDNMASVFSTEDNRLHTREDFESPGDIYVKCKGNYGKIYPAQFSLSIDSTPPSITYKHADDAFQFPIDTTLIIRTDEDTVCRYSIGNSDLEYQNMAQFPDYDEDDPGSYKMEHQQNLDSDDLIDHKTNRCYLMCMNKAGILSSKEYLDINADTTLAPKIIINSPKGTIADKSPLFNITTNKDSTCRISNRSDMVLSIAMSGSQKEHIYDSSHVFFSGEYTYYAECTFAVEGKVKRSFEFIVDDTPPEIKDVIMISELENISGKTARDDELCAEWDAEENQSSIEKYAYYVFWDKSVDELIEEGTTTGTSECIEADLNDSERYYFSVSAQNSAGLWSPNESSTPIQVDVSLAAAGCDNNLLDGDETDIDCGGSCDRCSDGKICSSGSDCSSGYCNESGRCAEPSCDDRVRNGAETDIDCGGSCKRCEVGQQCNKDKDCKTNNCDSSTGKCSDVLETCENSKLDADETDVDCGGSCPSCGIGKNCDGDSDCAAGLMCDSGKCSLDSDGDGISDEKDNCVDNANEDQADVDADGKGDACDYDSDNDELPDSFEQQYFDCATCANAGDDPDRDGMDNKEEYAYNTNPTKADTDGDGYDDMEEINEGTDPLDPSSRPESGFLMYVFVFVALLVLAAAGYLAYTFLMKRKPPAGRIPPGMPPKKPLPPSLKPPLRKPLTPQAKPPQGKAAEAKKPKPQFKKAESRESRAIFSRLSKIAEEAQKGRAKKKISSLSLTDKESSERVRKLKKELNIK